MRRHLLIVIIVIVAAFLRFFELGSIPSGLTWDEAAIGYSAYGILTNRRDEWLVRVPVVFRSFGDYKSPLLVYATVPTVAVFGLTPFSVRFPIAAASVFLVLIAYGITALLARDHLKFDEKTAKMAALASALFVALSPLALQFSRIGFESMLASVCLSGGLLLYFYGIRAAEAHRGRKQQALIFFLGHSLVIASLYAYHSAKIVAPLLVLVGLLAFRSRWKTVIRQWVVSGAVAGILAIPLVFAMIFGNANGRAVTTTVLTSHNPLASIMRNIGNHLDPHFLVLGKELTYRHSTKNLGVLSYSEAALVVAGILLLLVRQKNRAPLVLLICCIGIGFLPALIGKDTPHANRALLILPWIQIFSGISLALLISLRESRVLRAFVGGAIALLTITGFIQWSIVYPSTYQRSEALRDFGYGYEELFAFLRPLESTASRIFLTNSYGQAYIYTLFFKRLTPIEYQQGGLANYTFTDRPLADGLSTPNAILVLAQEEPPENASILKEVRYPDGMIAFRVIRVE